MPQRRSHAEPPRREAITLELRRRIESQTYAPDSFLPPERMLAEEFGVSRPTLRSAVLPLIRAGLLVNQPGVGTRVAGPKSETGRAGWKIIALVLPDIANRVFLEFTEAIEYTALQRGYHLLLCNSRHQQALEEMHIRQLVSRQVDGIILAHDPNRDFPSTLPLIEAAKIPTVFLFSSPAEVRADAVLFDERSGVDQVMRYLFSLGHRRVAFCRPVAGEMPHPRERAFLDFMRRQGAAVPAQYMVPFESMENAQSRETLQQLLSAEVPPTAFFAGNDRVALILLSQLAALGVRVPEEISVAGFDNQRFTEHLPIPLTTVDQPKLEMGRRAVEMLLEQIELDRPMAGRREIFQPHLIIRESCSVVRTSPAVTPVPIHVSP